MRILGIILVINAFMSPQIRSVLTIVFIAMVVLFNVYYTLHNHERFTGKRIGFMLVCYAMIVAGAQVLITGICPMYLFLFSIGLAVYLAEKLNIVHL